MIKAETVNLPAIEAWYDNSYAEQKQKKLLLCTVQMV